jgi:DNA-binding response OmpR family regulator
MHRVLVIEDEQHLLDLYRQELEDEGYKVMSVDNGENVIDDIKAFDPEIIVLDIKLGRTEGLKVLEQIKGFNLNLPVILNSAYSVYKQNFSSWIADDYVIKSPDLSELKSTIRRHIQDN